MKDYNILYYIHYLNILYSLYIKTIYLVIKAPENNHLSRCLKPKEKECSRAKRNKDKKEEREKNDEMNKNERDGSGVRRDRAGGVAEEAESQYCARWNTSELLLY